MLPVDLKHWRSLLPSESRRGHYTQREAARLLGVALRTYEDWEAGRSPIPGPVALACSAVLHGLKPFGEE